MRHVAAGCCAPLAAAHSPPFSISLSDPQISSELAAAAEGADLVVLEGMGRSIETNLHARMRCEAWAVLPGLHLKRLRPSGQKILWGSGLYHIISGQLGKTPCPFLLSSSPRCRLLPPLPQLRPAECGHDQAPRGGGGAGRPPLRLRVPVQAEQHTSMTAHCRSVVNCNHNLSTCSLDWPRLRAKRLGWGIGGCLPHSHCWIDAVACCSRCHDQLCCCHDMP